MSIPASTIVSVVPSVLAAGGNPLALNGLMLSQNTALPLGAPVSFPSLAAVQAYFGQYAWTGTATCASNTLTIVSTTSGTLAVGQEIQSTLAVGVPPGTYITALGTYSTGTGIGTVTISGPGFTQATASAMTSYCLESQMASVYFNGFTASTLKPTALLFSRFPGYAIGAFSRGGNVSAITASQISAIAGAGSMSITIDGTLKTSSTINLTTAVSGSVINWTTVASLLVTALSLSAGQVTYNSLFNALVVTSTTTGATSTITAAPGNVGVLLNLASTSPITPTLSQVSAAVAANTFMASLVLYTTNWAAFTTCYEPVSTDKQLLAAWTSGTGGQYVYAPYDSDSTITSSNASISCISYWARTNSYAGCFPVYANANGGPDAAALGSR